MAGYFPEEDAAQFCRRTDIEGVDLVFRDTCFLSRPNVGCTWGYDIPFRQIFVTDYQTGRFVSAKNLRSIQR